MTEEKEVETLSFYTTGECYTNTIRDLWQSQEVYLAFECCQDLPTELALDICVGKAKFTGDTREGDHTLLVEEDNTEVWPTLEEQIDLINENFIDYSNRISAINRYNNMSNLPNREMASYRANMVNNYDNSFPDKHYKDKELQSLTEKLNKIMKSIEVLYPLVGKSFVDLPILDLGTMYSKKELDYIQEEQLKFEARAEVRPLWSKGISERTKQSLEKLEDEEDNEEEPIEFLKVEQITDYCDNSYLDEKGIFWIAGFQNHINLAGDIRRAEIFKIDDKYTWPEDYLLEKRGWIKISQGRIIYDYFNRDHWRKLPSRQLDALERYFDSDNYSVFESASSSEGTIKTFSDFYKWYSQRLGEL